MEERLKRAIRYARAGEREKARNLLLGIVNDDEENELAWLWLVELVDDEQDKIIALENALVLNPENERAAELLRLLQRSAQVEDQPRSAQPEGPAAVRARSADARQAQAPPYERETEGPASAEYASSELDVALLADRDLMALGRAYAAEGRHAEAATVYEMALAQATTRTERNRIAKQLESARRAEQLQQPVPVHTNTNLWRLSAGPFLLYLILLLLQTAFRPWSAPFLLLAALSVLLGSLLSVATLVTERHPWWQRVFGSSGLDSTVERYALAFVGVILLIAPYALLMLSAFGRLSATELP